jgi:predicted NUDIX family NTP pyrophosphohydrolase
MAKQIITTAGLIPYRIKNGRHEIFLVHNGGPYYVKKDNQAWSFPKGGAHAEEDIFEAAKREFQEETSFEVPDNANFIKLEPFKASYKILHMWAFEKEYDVSKMKSNTCMIEWPPRSGKQIEIPEVDRGEYFDTKTAKEKIFAYLVPLVEQFEEKIT